jgi:hypothetical protein
MTRFGAVTAGMLVIAATVLFGCEPSVPPTATTKSAQPAAGSQPTAEEVANVRELMQNLGQRGAEGLPAGHPPIGNVPEKPTMPELPVASQAAVKLTYTAAATWQREPVRSAMRLDQYRLPRAAGDGEDGELVIFGAGIGGGIEANIARWRGQFTAADSQPVPDSAVRQEAFEANGLKITVVDITGQYAGGMSMGSTSAPTKENYRMLGAITETPGGPCYIKALGPDKTIEEHRAEFMDFLRSIKAE